MNVVLNPELGQIQCCMAFDDQSKAYHMGSRSSDNLQFQCTSWSAVMLI